MKTFSLCGTLHNISECSCPVESDMQFEKSAAGSSDYSNAFTNQQYDNRHNSMCFGQLTQDGKKQ